MKRVMATAMLAAMALPALADEAKTEAKATDDARLNQLETLVVTAAKEEPAQQRLRDFDIVVISAPKAQPDEHAIDEETARLLEEINQEK